MAATPPSFSPSRTTCASLLRELQMIWDEIGESDNDRDNTLLQLEQECLDIYHRRVEETRKHKADLYQWLAEAEAEVANIVSSLGECTILPRVGLVWLPVHFVLLYFISVRLHMVGNGNMKVLE
ncbi:hypothetical protein JHK87_036634 [Glycine soja]|nr:hypothetical protein JHK87_036634 [Glycine soja]